MEKEPTGSKGYAMYLMTFGALTLLTLLAVGLTMVRFSPIVSVTLILLLATVQVSIVLFFNMHLKFQDRILMLFTLIIFSMIFLTIIGTLVDYINR